MNILPLVIVWIALAVVVAGLFVKRYLLARNEDDSLHVMHGVISQQTTLNAKLEVIDKWGKLLTVITVLVGLLVAGLYIAAQFSGRSSVGG